MASISSRVGPSFAAYAQQTASDKANVSGAATEVEAVETPQANNSQANRPETTRAGAVTNLRDLPGAHPYSLLQEGKREGKTAPNQQMLEPRPTMIILISLEIIMVFLRRPQNRYR